METDQKTPGQVLYEAQSVCGWQWHETTDHERRDHEQAAQAVLAHDRANQPAASGVTDTQRLDWIDSTLADVVYDGFGVWAVDDFHTIGTVRKAIDAAMALAAAPEAPKP